MERGRNNETKSSFKMKKTPAKFIRGRGRTAAEVAQDEMSEQGRSGIFGDMIKNAGSAVEGQVATDPVPRPTPEGPQNIQGGYDGTFLSQDKIDRLNQFLGSDYGDKIDTFFGRMSRREGYGANYSTYGGSGMSMGTGPIAGLYGGRKRAPSGPLAFKSKSSGFKMKKK
tara:strand:+ start:39 stop:545 length:507 start_codon:yes stop_codon:yes gene_type:complete